MRARALQLARSFDGRVTMTVEIDRESVQQAQTLFDELRDAELSIDVKQYKERRSLDANAYFWTLCGKLAYKLGTPKEDIYRSYIKDIGGNFDIVCVQETAAEKLQSGWARNGIGWTSDTLQSKIDGCVNVILYYGSSTYTTEQMSKLIDMAVYDCKQNGIETATPAELERLIGRWE